MSSDKRLLLAVGISFLILILYPFYLRLITPETGPPPQDFAATPAADPYSEETHRLPASNDAGGFSGEQAQNLGSHAPHTPAQLAAPENLYAFSNNRFNAQFSSRGAVLTKLELKNWGKEKNGDAKLVDQLTHLPSKSFLVQLPNQGVDFRNQTFALEILNEESGVVQFSAKTNNGWKLEKEFRFDQEKPIMSFAARVRNQGAVTRRVSLEVYSDLLVDVSNNYDRAGAQVFVSELDKLSATSVDKLAKKPYATEGEIAWQALARKYFTIAMRPDEPAAFSKAWASSPAENRDLRVMHGMLQFPPAELAPGEELTQNFLVYAGPQYYGDLKTLDNGFDKMLSHGFFGTFKLLLLKTLFWTHKAVGNYGWAIILVTCAIKLLFTPLTHMSFETTRRMQALQPKLKALQAQYKNDQARLSQEMMALYKRHKVNPMSGCLPMLFQIPVFIAFYQVLIQAVELKGAPFMFWINDLSEPDRLLTLPQSLPVLGDGINVLPILMLGSMVWQQKLTPQTGSPEQQKIMTFMPLIFGVIFYSLPSGLVLYWLVNNVLSVFHQLFIKGKALPHHED